MDANTQLDTPRISNRAFLARQIQAIVDPLRRLDRPVSVVTIAANLDLMTYLRLVYADVTAVVERLAPSDGSLTCDTTLQQAGCPETIALGVMNMRCGQALHPRRPGFDRGMLAAAVRETRGMLSAVPLDRLGEVAMLLPSRDHLLALWTHLDVMRAAHLRLLNLRATTAVELQAAIERGEYETLVAYLAPEEESDAASAK